jgi:tetratricopeptide (TPR) repeat protein
LQQAEVLVQSFPKSFITWRLLGAVNFGLERFDQAARALRQACRLVPGYPDVHSDLGVALRSQGKLDDAIAAFQRTIAIKNDHPNAHTNLGLAFFDQGKLDKAIEAYRRAIAINPGDSVAYGSLGLAFFDQGKPAEAIIAYQRAIAINPRDAVAHANLGLAFADQGKLDEAITAYRQALAVHSGDPTINLNLGVALRKQGKLDEAITAYQRAIAIKPLFADAYYNLGLAMFKQGKLDEAIVAYQRAIVIKPDHADAYSNFGIALRDQGKLDEAIVAYQRAIAIKPNHANAYSNLGNALFDLGNLDDALAAYRRALAIDPDHADAFYNLGNVLGCQGNLNDALAAYRRVLAIDPNYADAHWNLSLALLTQGHFTSGWSEHEWRWKIKDLVRTRLSSKPLWLGTPSLRDRTILLWGEQGLGDQIQFARYATSISELGARVILEVSDPLVRVLGDLRGVSKIVAASTPVPDSGFDFHCPLMSLPLALGTELSTIPDAPRLTTHMQNVPRWAERVPSSMPKIGIAWSGNPKHKNDRNRSVALSQLAPILTPHATWISLQKELRDADRPTFDAAESIRHFGNQLDDFLDTAALCEQCDLVISVDTSVAHLAATLGRPVWLLLPFAADWRWLQDHDDSPWYPTMKLYRQQQIGDWEGVFQRVKVDLQTWLTQR